MSSATWLVSGDVSGCCPTKPVREGDVVVLSDVHEQFRVRVTAVDPTGETYTGRLLDPTRHNQSYTAGTVLLFRRDDIASGFRAHL